MNTYEFYEDNGIRYLSQSFSTFKMLEFNRDNLDAYALDGLSNTSGLYILYNENSQGDSAIYIGESENVYERLKQHQKSINKSFWSGTIVFHSSDGSLNKAHYKNLEYRVYEQALNAGRNKIVNRVIPTKSKLSLIDENKISKVLDIIKTLLLKRRFYMLEHPFMGETIEYHHVFFLYHYGGTGKMLVEDDNKYTVLRKSIIMLNEEDEDILKLIKRGKIRRMEDTTLGELLDDISFTSDNEAAFFVTGDPDSDWTNWINYKGEHPGGKH